MALRWCDMGPYEIEDALRRGAGKLFSRLSPRAAADVK